MFNREDYWPYIVGVMVFSGLIGIPAIYGSFVLPLMDEPFASLPRRHVLLSSLIASAIYSFAHTRDGGLSLARLLGGLAIAALLYVRSQGASLFVREHIIFLPTGIFGLILMSAGGWVGILMARWTGISQHLVPKDPSDLQQFGVATQEPESAVSDPERAPDYGFSQQVYDELLDRTRHAWLAGTYESWRPGMRKLTEATPVTEFYKLIAPAFEATSVAFAHTPPLDDEVLVWAEDGGESVSTVVTNQRFFFFETDPNRLSDHYPAGVVAIDKIKSCEIHDKFLSKGATLGLDDGSTLEVEGLKSVGSVECIHNRLHPKDVVETAAQAGQEPTFIDPANLLQQMHDGTPLPSAEELRQMSEDESYRQKFIEHLAFGTNKQQRAEYVARRDQLPAEFTTRIAEQMATAYDDSVSDGLRMVAAAGVIITAGALYFTFVDFRWWLLLVAVLGALPAFVWRNTARAANLIADLRR